MSKPTWMKYWITRAGEHISPTTVANLNHMLNFLEIGRWMREQGYDTSHRSECREQLFDLVGQQVQDRDVLYLEFGVWKGDATRYWAKLLRNPLSKLHGFDSFEGLPEDWAWARKGVFSTKGVCPQVADERIKFFKGWFEETLPNYTLPPHDVLVLNLDADLYSATIYVLNRLREAIRPGTYLYFDEINERFHELRAFREFCATTGMKFRLLGATRTLRAAMFQRIA